MVCYPAAWLTLMMFWTCGSREALATFNGCAADQTLIHSDFVYDDSGRTCAEIISEKVDKYHPDFIDDCKRWMGSEEVGHVEDYHITRCNRVAGGKIRYRAKVCCEGPVEQRCFECTNFTSRATCQEHAPSVVCAADQVCQTRFHYVNYHPRTVAYGTTGCVDRSICYQGRASNSANCVDWLTNPNCTFCCYKPNCNYWTPRAPKIYVGNDPCLSDPCENGGTCNHQAYPDITYTCTCPAAYTDPLCTTCVLDPCEGNPCHHAGLCISHCTSFTCECRIGWTGDRCDTSYPQCLHTENICENGGTCYDHGSFGKRCKCPEYFMGTYCEIAKPNCTHNIAYRAGYRELTIPDTDCTERLSKEKRLLHNSKFLFRCANFMRNHGGLFTNGVNGHVPRLESISHATCASGDRYTFETMSWCCPSCHSMPCRNGGWCTQTEDNDYQCKCRHGWYGRNCDYRRQFCEISGDPHFVTFDGLRYSFQAAGEYEACSSKWGTEYKFTVSITNEKIGLVSYLSSITIKTCDQVVVLKRNREVTVNGIPVDPANYQTFNCLQISMNGYMVRVHTTYDLIIDYDGHHIGFIHLHTDLMRMVKGLCGNFDKYPRNDWRTRANEMLLKDSDREYKLGKGWEIGDSGDTLPAPVIDCTDIQDTIDSDAYCGHLKNTEGMFRDCMADEAITAATDLADCEYDVCAHKDDIVAMKSAACDAMESLVLKCEGQGYGIDWREDTGCSLVCDEGFLKVASATACPASCRMPDAPATCELPDREGCVCPSGTLLSKGQCIPPAECGCIDEYGNEFQVGQSWMTDTCDKRECTMCDTCTQPSIGHLNHTCPEDTLCSSYAPGRGSCLPYIDPCLPNPCRRRGVCEANGWNFICKCRIGTTRKNCWKTQPECPAVSHDYCDNGGTCYDHGRLGFRCKCPKGFVGSKCEIPVPTCSDPVARRHGAHIILPLARNEHGMERSCTSKFERIEDMRDVPWGLKWCKVHMARKYGGKLFEDGVDGTVTKVEKRYLSECAEGDAYLFARLGYCCPSCYSHPCRNGGSCFQRDEGAYTCRCPTGWTGDTCDISIDMT